MKAEVASHRYVSGPHAGDYYLLLDEQSECILETRLAAHMHEAGDTAILAEMWVDDADKQVWYVFEI